jgi:hypothetical protein
VDHLDKPMMTVFGRWHRIFLIYGAERFLADPVICAHLSIKGAE